MDRIHVLPINDLKEHVETGTYCWCKPKVIKKVGSDDVVVHNAADNREVQEFWDREIAPTNTSNSIDGGEDE